MHALSLEYPSTVVPIDTSESNFNRLSSVRRSLIHVDFLIKRKKNHKRRNTISDGNSKEIQEALSSRKKSGTMVKTEALIHSSCQTDDDLLGSTSASGNRTTRSKLRSDGSPSSGELSSSSAENNTKSEKRSSFYEAMNFKLGRDWKFLKKSGSKKELAKNEKVAGDGKVESATSTGGTEKKRKSFLPISTNSAAMTVAVKLRETSARTGAKGMEDGQSSSGNWSASSSTRASVDSDQQNSMASPETIPHSHSESSLSKDSLFSDNTHPSTDGRSHDGTVAGYTSDISLAATTAASSWKPGSKGIPTSRSNINSTSSEQESQSGTITPEGCQSDSKSSSPGIRKVSVGSDPFTNPIDDGDSSVYSVDTDGYYTSMHTDSGLKHAFGKFDGEARGNFAAIGEQGSQTSIDTIGNLSLNSFLSQNANDTGTDNCSIASTMTQKSKVPPAPPPRLSSTRTLSPVLSQKEHSPPVSAGDVSESDCEVGERLKRKTSISSFRYPSICAVSPEPSDEETCRLDHSKRMPMPNGSCHSSEKSVKNRVNNSVPADGEMGPTSEKEETLARCNVYGMQSPRKMLFLNAVVSQSTASPKVEKQPTLGSFVSAEAELLLNTADLASKSHTSIQTAVVHEKPVDRPVGEGKALSNFIDMQQAKNVSSSLLENGGIVETSEKLTSDGSQSISEVIPVTKTPDLAKSPSMPCPPESPIAGTPTNPSYTPFYLNRPSSLMSRTRSPFLSYLSRNASPTKTSTPSPPSPVCSPSFMGSYRTNMTLPTNSQSNQVTSGQSTPKSSSPSTSAQTSPQTTPPAVPPPPPPLTYSSSVLEQGSKRLPSVTNEPNSVFSHPSSLSRAGARVTLDPEGKVIYSSNSLGRRRDGQLVSYCPQQLAPQSTPSPEKKYATLPTKVSPVISSNPRAYVRLDPSGKVETYSSSTVPRTRHSISVPAPAGHRLPSPSADCLVTPSSPPRCQAPSTLSNATRMQIQMSGARIPQPEQRPSGRSTPQSASVYTQGPAARSTPIQRPASISAPYGNRSASNSTPVSQQSSASSGRVTPVHHFSPISLPSSTAPGRRTPLQPSPREPIGPGWVSGLPPPLNSSPVAGQKSPQHAPPYNLAQYPPMTTPQQQFNGRTTPVRRYTPSNDPYIPNNHSPSRGFPEAPVNPAPSPSFWGSERMTPVQVNQSHGRPYNAQHSYGSPEERSLPNQCASQIYRQENPAAYAPMRRIVPVTGQVHQGSVPETFVNGRATPIELLGQASANLQYGSSNRNCSGRTTPGMVQNRQGARVSMSQSQNYRNFNHAVPVLGKTPGNKDCSNPLSGSGALVPGQYGQTHSMQNGVQVRYQHSPQGHPTSPTRQPYPPDHTDSMNFPGLPHVGVQVHYPQRGAGPMGPYSSHPQSLQQTQRNPERRAFILSGSRMTPDNHMLHPATYSENNRKLVHSQSPCLSPSWTQSTDGPSHILHGLHKQGSPTGLSSTSISSSGSEKSPDNSSTSSTSITRELQRKPMSTEDLFAVIHSSKKKHGIRTEADLAQSPLSSRSSSPMVTSRPSTPSRGGLAETGFLSPRGSRDRRSWSGDVSATRISSPSERRSLANDRLGPAKPTSLMDFKKLLLHTKTSSQNGQEKKSAVELLKASTAVKAAEDSPLPSLPSPVNVQGPVENSNHAAWTSTVPLKRGGRVRSSLQHRYDLMYPPILEDCSEELPDGKAGSTKAADRSMVDRIHMGPGQVPHAPSSSTWV